MFHVKHLLVCLLFPLWGWSQAYFTLEDKPLNMPHWEDKEVKEQVVRQVIGKKLEVQEVSFYYWCNMLRKNPAAFHEKVILPFLKQFPEADGKEARELAADLLAVDRLPLFEYSSLARSAALEHAKDLSKREELSHYSAEGRRFNERVRISGITRCAGENLYTGKNDGLLALIMLLLDIGLEPAGHRKALLSPYYVQMAPAILTHQSGKRAVLVQVFTCK